MALFALLAGMAMITSNLLFVAVIGTSRVQIDQG